MPKPLTPWLQAYPTDVPATLPFVRGPLDALLTHAASQWPQRTALGFMGRTWTYDELNQLATMVARALQIARIEPGDRVALCLPNCPAYVAAFFGVLRTGAVVVNLNPLYSAAELHHMLADSGAKAVIGLALQPVWGKLLAARKNTAVRKVVAVDLADFMPWHIALGFRIMKARERVSRFPYYAQTWKAFLATARGPLRPHRRTGRQAAVLQYTGGTTGAPKAAVLTHSSLLSNAAQVRAWLGQPKPEGDALVAVLPLFHVFALTGILLMGLSIGAAIHLMPQFQLKVLLQLVQRVQATLLPGVPALFNALTLSPLTKRYSLRSLRFCISGGAPLPAATRERFEALTGAKLVEGYGLTEASPVVACGPHTGETPAGSVGLPLPGTFIVARDPDHPQRTLPIGKTGELWVRGPQLMARYWRQPAATRAVLRQGWLRTGDAGYIDARGFVFVTDRLKDIIFVNGYKIFPRQIEEILARHQAVQEVAVVASPHPHKGEMPVAYISFKNGRSATLAELKNYSAKFLNKLEIPEVITVLDSLPKTLVGKIDKKPLRELARNIKKA